jgi:CPA1 family monovalent cation:H+ antiporter
MGLFAMLQGGGEHGAVEAVHTSPVISLVGAVVGLLVLAAIVDPLAKRLKIPFTVALVVSGALLAVLADHWSFLAPMGALEVTPDAVFFVFLPTLIFQSAFHLDARSLRANLAPTLVLAIPGLLISTALIGAIMHTVGPSVGFEVSWAEALLLGSILSATDPVAVISLFGQLGAPKRLTVLVEGESLFNDATAIVISRIILGVMAAGVFVPETLLMGLIEFVKVFFGGLVVGAALAWLAGTVIGKVRSDSFIEITATTVLAYLSFYVAEHNLHLSGVMAVVAAGVMIGGWGKTKISPSVGGYLTHFWDYMAAVANALIFLLVGLTVDLGALVDALPILAWVILAMLVSRALVIFSLVPVVGRLPNTEPVSRSYRVVMYWGGLRGAIALAIAFSLPDTMASKDQFVTIAIGAVLFTLIVQGIPPVSDQLARLEGFIAGKMGALQELPKLQEGGLFPPRVSASVHERTESELAWLRKKLNNLRELELDEELELRTLYLRSFGSEGKLYFEMFGKGHLSESAYRDLVHSLALQSDAIRFDGRVPDFTLYPPGGGRIGGRLLRFLERLPVLDTVAESWREARTERDYEIAWARFQGSSRVIEELERLGTTAAHRAGPVAEVVSRFGGWRTNAQSHLDQTAELFPEFVAAVQVRLADRLAVQAERDAIEKLAKSGTLPGSVAHGMFGDLDQRAEALGAKRTGKLAIDPEELLRKVPFFQGLPKEEFARVSQKLHRRTAPGGDLIVEQGQRGSSLFLVARGVVRVIRRDAGIDHDVATLLAGDFFGEMALLHGGTRNATCRAVTPCSLYELARSDLDEVMQSCPSMREALNEADARRREELRQSGAVLDDA